MKLVPLVFLGGFGAAVGGGKTHQSSCVWEGVHVPDYGAAGLGAQNSALVGVLYLEWAQPSHYIYGHNWTALFHMVLVPCLLPLNLSKPTGLRNIRGVLRGGHCVEKHGAALMGKLAIAVGYPHPGGFLRNCQPPHLPPLGLDPSLNPMVQLVLVWGSRGNLGGCPVSQREYI